MITPTIIKILFYISIAASVILGILTIIAGFATAFDQGRVWPAIGSLFAGPLVTVVAIFIARIYSELMILAFKIHEHLVAIRNMMAAKQ